MPKRRTSSLSLSLALAFALFAPQAALGSSVTVGPAGAAGPPDPTAVLRAEAEAGGADAIAAEGKADEGVAGEGKADEARQPKRKGNALARVLSAPFRALARLFGGGGKSKTEAAGKPAARAQEAAAAAPRSTQHPDDTEAAPVVAASVAPIATPGATAEAPRGPANVVQPGARATEGVRIVRPGEGARELQPKMWIPLIVGVPSDAVSQGRALLQHGYIQEAIAELQIAATNVGPQLAEANTLLGLAYDRLGWHRQAAEAYGRALTVSPKDYVALTNLGYSLYLADDYAGALKRLKQAAKLAPTEPVIFNNLGVVNARLGRYGDAYKNFARASNEYDAHLKLADILEERRRDKDALKHYEAALRLQPGASAVLERLVALYERTGARDKAETARRALGQPQRNQQKTTTGGGGG